MAKLLKTSWFNPLASLLALGCVGLFLDVATIPFVQLMAVYICINVILAISLNLINGFTGQLSLGHAGFMAIGAYGSAWLSMTWQPFPASLSILNFPIYALFGGTLAAIAGFIVGLPSLRLRGDYLAIVTLGFGEIIRVVLLNIDAVGGARGLYGIPGIIVPLDSGVSTFFLSFLMSGFWVLVAFFFLWRLMKSSYGRTFLSVREDEIAAEAMGVNTTRAKVIAFVISSFFAGIAGHIFAHLTGVNYLNPATFTFIKSIDSIIMIVLGGMGSFTGSIIAAFIVTLLPELLRPLQEITGVDLRMVIYSVALILMMILRPQGLMGKKELPDLLRRWRAT